MGGNEKFADRLEPQFKLAAPLKFVVPHGYHAEGWLDYENQPSLHKAHLFSYAQKPWLTQYWVRRVQEECYSDTIPYGGYNDMLAKKQLPIKIDNYYVPGDL